MNPMSRKALLTVGGVATAATLVLGGGVASAADGTTTPTAAATAHPRAAAHVQHRLDKRVARQTRLAGRLDKDVLRITTRAAKLTTKVGALPDGTAKTDATAKLADLAARTAAAKAADATVLTALHSATDVAATKATLTADLALLRSSRSDIRAARLDVVEVAHDLRR